jgi:excisionase family DNA binding protein
MAADGGSAGPAQLNLKQVAARLGVHYMTAYRYVRTGRLDAHQEGTAWVVDAAAVERFLALRDQQDLGGESDRPEPSDGSGVDWGARLRRPLLTGDEVAAWRVVEQALTAGRSPQACYLDVLGGALARVDDDGPAGIAGGLLATATAHRVVARLGARFRRPGRSKGTVIFGAPLGELHSLPIAVVADLVRMEGFTCLELGANVPPEAFAGAAEGAHRLVAVGLGATSADNLESLRDAIAAVQAARPDVPVVVGGQAVRSPELAALSGATAWAEDGIQAVAVIRQLAERQTVPSTATPRATSAASTPTS